ncbi:MAG: dienelactone hydrolase family protein [Planctomycetota bacterium]
MKSFAALLLLALVPLQSDKDPARARLDKSPRHHEWVDVKNGERMVRCFVVFPEVKTKAAAVLVIHENKGLTDWVRSVADQLAEAGYIAIAPDLLTGKGPEGGNTDAFKDVDSATQALYKLDPAQVTADLAAVADHVIKLPAADGKLSVAGFCWGGSQSFDFASRRKDLKAAFVFYGSAPKDESLFAKIECPVYGFYGENDARINATLPATTEAMKKAGKVFEPITYTGAGHGFLRAGEAPDASEPNKKARADAWERWKKLLAPAPAK